MTQTGNGRTERKSLANEIDRLDGILDGLDEALAGSVETAVRDVVGQVVRETVEATVREVLSNPELIRSALAHHAPVVTPAPEPRRTLKDKLARLYAAVSETVSRAKRGLGSAWVWCVEKFEQNCRWLSQAGKIALSLAHAALCAAWKYRKTTLVALTVGSLIGVGAYFCGPVIASSLCGVGGTVTTGVSVALWSVWKAIRGGSKA